MELDVFGEALETLEDIKSVANDFHTAKTHEMNSVNQDRLLHDVVKLRQVVIGTTKCTESERTRLISAANQEGLTVRSLSSLHSRIEVLGNRITEMKTSLEDQDHRKKVEGANERVMAAKKRLGLKREIFNVREKALSSFRSELGPILKLGTSHSISEFDDEERVNDGFWSLPRPLQYLYGQLRNLKKSENLPIEVSIVSKVKWNPPSGDPALLESMSASMKKGRSSDKKTKYNPGEKRRKRWYEAIMGKEGSGPSQEDWMPQQRSRNAFLLIPTKPKMWSNEITTPYHHPARKYQLLMKLVENSEKQPITKKKSKIKKVKKRPHGVSSPTRETPASSLFSLPLPEVGPLCVEIKLIDDDKIIARLQFSWYLEKVFVMSSPDWLLAKTLKSQIHPVPVSSKSIVAHFGYPFDWAQELCGVELMKEEVLDLDRMKTINEAMIQQQDQMLKFIIHARNQANDLNIFRSGLRILKTKLTEASRKDSEKTRIISLSQISIDKLRIQSRPIKSNQDQSNRRHFASGWWTVVLRKLTEEEKAPAQQTEIEKSTLNPSLGPSLRPSLGPHIKMKFFPHNGFKEISQKSGIEKGDFYYQWSGSTWTSPIIVEASEKLKELSSEIPVSLIGPISSSELSTFQQNGLTDELFHGKLIVQKRPRIPKRFQGLLPMDYEKRFYPFHLQGRKKQTSMDMIIPETQTQFYRIYKIIIQRGYIQLSILYQVNLLTPLMPSLTIEGVFASSEFSRKVISENGKDSKDRSGGIDGKRSNDHVRIEREKILKQEGEALKIRDQFDQIAEQLETLPEETGKQRQNKVPYFRCDDAKEWITSKLTQIERISPDECIKRIEDLLKEWCEDHSSTVKTLNEFLDSGGKGKKKDSQRKRISKPPKELRRDKRSTGEGKATTHDDELEQGEIPSIPAKHSSRRRGRETDTPRTRERQRSPVRNRSLQSLETREPADRSRRLPSPRQTTQSTRIGPRIISVRVGNEVQKERRSHSATHPRRG